MSTHPANNTPADVVLGVDSRFVLTDVVLPGKHCTCTYEGTVDEMEEHLRLAHPASRNPEVTCQETAFWDGQRWCVRAKGHPVEPGNGAGGHWTPTHVGGGKFW